ncbi:MAG: ferredoxin, partial [Halobacteria archaeon]|nr:ferredoxin [Halobacteria archaeon]
MAIVKYLNYEVLDDHGWSMDDDDLFEKAADADLG